VLAKAVERANQPLTEADEAPLPTLTPHGLRRTFARVLYALGEDPGVVMDDIGHKGPDLALTVYRQSIRRDEGEREVLRVLVEGAAIGSNGSDAASESVLGAMDQAR
jgi:integrase